MDRHIPNIGLTCLGLLLLAGCSTSPWSARNVAATTATAATVATPSATPASPATGPVASTPDPNAVEALVNEVAQSEQLDPTSREKLAHDLRQTDPTLWPLMVQTFRATLAYRRQVAQRDAQKSAAEQASPLVHRSPQTPGDGPSSQDLPPPLALSEQPAQPAPADRTVGNPAARVAPESADRPFPEKTGRPVQAAASNDLPSPGPTSASAGHAVAADAGRPAAESPLPRSSTPRRDDQVERASHEVPLSDDWRQRLADTIAGLEQELKQAPQTPREAELQARLRVLYLLAGKREDALRPISSAPSALQEFWSQELYGLSTWLDSDRITDPARRASEARVQLAGAAHRLGELAPLVLRNLSFITEVDGYGDMKPVDKCDFSPEQIVGLYVEVENFKSEETPKGFHTAFHGHYQIFDTRGQRVAHQDLGKTEEHCRNPRRDYFLSYQFPIPKRIYPGRYSLQLTLEDVVGQKVGQSSVDFTVKDAGP